MNADEVMTNEGLAVALLTIATIAFITFTVRRWRETSVQFADHQADMDREYPRVLLCEVARCERPASTIVDAGTLDGLAWICSFHGDQMRRAVA